MHHCGAGKITDAPNRCDDIPDGPRHNRRAMRLNKYISESGICSRREADAWIAAGRVTVNGAPGALGTQVKTATSCASTGSRCAVRKKPAGLHRAEQAGRHHLHDRARRARATSSTSSTIPSASFPSAASTRIRRASSCSPTTATSSTRCCARRTATRRSTSCRRAGVTAELPRQMAAGVRIDAEKTKPRARQARGRRTGSASS